MPKKSAEFEREREMSMIWGTGGKNKRNKSRAAAATGGAGAGGRAGADALTNKNISALQQQGAVRIHADAKQPGGTAHAQPLPDDYEDAVRQQKRRKLLEMQGKDDDDDLASTISFVSDTADEKKHAAKAAARTKAKKDKKANDPRVRLHCFVEPGTTKNDVREVFEGYGDPDVELRTSQKGNVLNKTHFAVVTFRNKALALWAAMHLDGSNQRDTIGTNPMVLNMFLSREEQKLVKRRAAAKKAKSENGSKSAQ